MSEAIPDTARARKALERLVDGSFRRIAGKRMIARLDRGSVARGTKKNKARGAAKDLQIRSLEGASGVAPGKQAA